MYEYHIQLSEKDYINFNKFHLLHSKSGKQIIRRNQLMFPVISFFLLLLIWWFDGNLELLLIEAIVLGVMSIILVFFTKGLLIKNITKQLNKLKKEGKLPYSERSIVTFEDDGIREKTAHSETKTSYALVEKIKVSDETIYVYISAVQALIIPKTCYCADKTIDELLFFLNEKCNLNQ